jgi:hypothetical protein
MRYNDQSTDVTRWTTTKLFRRLRETANLTTFGVDQNEIAATYKVGWHDQVNKDQPRIDDFIREQTRVYRQSWLDPIIDELERRFGASPATVLTTQVRIIALTGERLPNGEYSARFFVRGMKGDTPYNAFGPGVEFDTHEAAEAAIITHNKEMPERQLDLVKP